MSSIAPMTDSDRTRVNAAVTKAEGETAGEIVTIITGSSDSYNDVALVWAAAAALTALCVIAAFPYFYLGLWSRLFGYWVEQWRPGEVLVFAATAAALKFFGAWLILLWRPLRIWLTPRFVRNNRVHARAVTCFKVGAERRTSGRTGILIYLSLAERRAEIVADEAIASKVPAAVWGDALAAMLIEIKQGRMADGMIAAIGRVGVILAEHFPRDSDDKNELPDRLIEV